MNLDFFNVDEFAENLQEIKTVKIYNKHGFHPDGLFSERIFGPVRTATCGCKIYHGRSRIGEKCNTCDVDITFANQRRVRFAKIVLPWKLMNPVMFYIIKRAGKTKIKDIIDNLLFSEKIIGYYFDKKLKNFLALERIVKEKESDEEEEVKIPEGVTLYSGIDGLYDLVCFQCSRLKDKDPMWQIVADYMDKFYISNVLVPPPEFRPVSKTKNDQMRDEMNKYFMKIINFSLTMKDDNIDSQNILGIKEVSFRNLQRHVFELYEYIFKKMSKKTGIIRGSILGKRVDFSGRAVISPDPTLQIDQCSIPYVQALELYKLEVANLLLEKRMMKRYDAAIDHIDECIRNGDFSLYEVAQECCEDQYVILNRQPTLHRMGLLSFRVKLNKDYVIKIHPMVCEPYNADFDGDQMAIYRALYPETQQECKDKLSIKSNLLSPTTGGLITGINQDILLGLYLLTSDDSSPSVEYEGIHTNTGRVLFNDCLPEDYAFINKQIGKKLIRVILDDICRMYPADLVAGILDNIKTLGFETTTKYGCTMSLKNMRLQGAEKLASDILDDTTTTWVEKFTKLQSPEIMNEVKRTFPYSSFIESGSRGSWDQATQIMLSRGFISNFTGEVIQTPIKSNLISGLSRREFFDSCYGSRKGLLDTALNTGDSGYLTRKLVYSSVNLELHAEETDCGAVETFSLMIPKKDSSNIDSAKLAKCLIGRYTVDGLNEDGSQNLKLITYENYHTFIGTMVHLRSPIFCKSKDVCHTCYGTSKDTLHSKYIGIIAAQSFGEVSTQLVLRTFHTSGAAKITDKSGEHQDIVNDLTAVKKIFHATSSKNWEESILSLFKIYSNYSMVLLVHYECILSQMMRDGNERWRLTDDRDITKCELVSIESVPSKESWLLGLAFSKPKEYLIDGIIADESNSAGILERIMTNDEL